MTRTRSSSPGRTAGLTAFASEGDELRVDLRDVRERLVEDLDRRRRILLHLGEDLEAAPAPVAAQGVRGIRDVLQLLEDELGDDEGAVDEPGLDDVLDPAVDDRARVDDDVRVAGDRD